MKSIKEYPFSLAVLCYGIFFLIFVSTLCCFHTVLIKDFKTTAELLKKEQGEATGQLRKNPYSYNSYW